MKRAMNLKKSLQLMTVTAISALSMGNQSCEEKQANQPRELRKFVEVGHIEAKPVKLPNDNVFDMQFVVNQQIYSALYESGSFTYRYNPPLTGMSLNSEGQVVAALNMSDQSRLFFEKTMGKSANAIPIPSKMAECFVKKPQVKVNGTVNSFELADGGGISLGYSPAGGHNPNLAAGLSFNVKRYELNLTLRGLSPIKNTILGDVTKTNKKSDKEMNFTFSFSDFLIGPSFFTTTPMAKVTKKTLVEAVGALKNEMKKDPWSSRVLAFSEGDGNLVTIIGGTNVNLEKGDQLAIYNETYYWHGDPCESELWYEGGVAVTPVAIVEVLGVDLELSWARIIEVFNEGEPPVMGAKVKVHKLKEPTPAPTPEKKPKTNLSTQSFARK